VTGYDADELCPDCAREKDDCAKDEAADARRNDWELGVDIIEEDDLESPF
jgi:hypothetical protein